MNRKKAIVFCVFIWVVWLCPVVSAQEDDLVQESEYILYVPARIPGADELSPLVIAFSPSADAFSMIETWKDVAQRHKWFILASKEFRNGREIGPIISKLEKIIKELLAEYPIDKTKIVAAGFSGGGMISHIFSFMHPELISAVVVNTGMISEAYIQKREYYPRGKLAVFLASVDDFRYSQMQRDEEYLKSLGWQTKWIEFSGGHIIAAQSAYQDAAQWLMNNFGAPRSKVLPIDKMRPVF